MKGRGTRGKEGGREEGQKEAMIYYDKVNLQGIR